MLPFFVYILRCSDGTYYTGHTDDIYARMDVHNAGALKGYTSKRLPVELLWVYMTSTRQQAYELEMRIKKFSRLKKESLIKKDWKLFREFSRKNFNKEKAKKADFLRY